MKNLTYRQTEVLSFLEDFIKQNGYAPSVREVAKEFDIYLKGAADHIAALKKKGRIDVTPNRARTIRILK